MIRLEQGEPIVFGKDKDKGVVRTPDGHLHVVDVAEVGTDALIRHDAHAADPGLAFALSRLSDVYSLQNTPIGIFRDVNRPSYDRLVREQVASVKERRGAGDLQGLLTGHDTWTVG